MELISSRITTEKYRVTSQLSKLCFPQEHKYSSRRIAWANSLCILFLSIGCLGLKALPLQIRPLTEVVEFTPIEIPPVEEPPTLQTREEPREGETPSELAAEPSIATPVVVNASGPIFPM